MTAESTEELGRITLKKRPDGVVEYDLGGCYGGDKAAAISSLVSLSVYLQRRLLVERGELEERATGS